MKCTLINALLIFTGLTSTVVASAQVSRPPQFVLMAFDGSQSHSMWKKTTQFADQQGIKFTYFISGVYFMRKGDGYVSPRGTGKSDIGFGESTEDIAARNGWVLQAMNSGNEMASHANGHFDGSGWSESQWARETEQFHNFLASSAARFGGVSNTRQWEALWQPGGTVIGFRAPLLAQNQGMYRALKNYGYKYDTSRVDKMSYWPTVKAGLWDFPLAGLRMARSGKKTLSMDYNMYVAQSGGSKGAEANYSTWENEVYETYMNYFANNYYGNRAPVHIGHHFSLWNGGIYWKAMQRVAQTVCNLPEVRCVTYKELTQFVSQNAGSIPAYQAGNFQKLSQGQVALPSRVSLQSELTNAEIQSLKGQVCPASAHLEENLEEVPPGEYL